MSNKLTARDPQIPDAQHLATTLHSISIHLLRRLRREDEAAGLTAPRLSALSVIVFSSSPVTPSSLAAAEQVRPPTMTRILNALHAQGLILRHPSPTDARTVHLTATPAGRQLLSEGRQRRVSALARHLAALSAADRTLLSQATLLLQQVVSRMEPYD